MDRRKLTSAVFVHAGACLVAFMAVGSSSAEMQTVDEGDQTVIEVERGPTPLPSMNSSREDAADPASKANEAPDNPRGDSISASSQSSGSASGGSSVR